MNEKTRITLAEAIGTMILVVAGPGTAILATGAFTPGSSVTVLGVAIAFGLGLLCAAYAIGSISGCHINPAVTFGLLASGRISSREAVEYWIGQFAGALVATFVTFVLIKSRQGGYDLSDNGFGANGYGNHSPDGYPLGAAIIIEVVMTGLLVFTVLAATDRIANVAFAGIPIGLVLTLIHLVAIPVDNTSVNPARSFGPAVFVGGWALGQLWVFILAPIVGATLGSVVHRALFEGETRIPAEESAVAADNA
jgi:aquaporin Z